MKFRSPRPLGGRKKPPETPPIAATGRCGWCSREWKFEDYRRLTDSEYEFTDIGFTVGSDGDYVQLCPRCTDLMDSFADRVRQSRSKGSDA